MQFDGGAANTFSGGMFLLTQGNGQVIFAKSSAVAAPTGVNVYLGQNANLVVNGTGNQFGSQSTISVTEDSTLNISGTNNSTAVGMLALTNSPQYPGSPTISSSVLLALNNGISADLGTTTIVLPAINANLTLNNFLNINVNSQVQSLTINGNIGGNGFEKTGNGGLYLNGNSTFFGDMEITAGTVQPVTAQSFGQPTAPYGVELNGGILQIQGISSVGEPVCLESAIPSS